MDRLAHAAAEQKRRKTTEIGSIPVPPKYKSSDFLSNTFWRLRGALDVPKERFVSYPHCARDADGSLVVAWAGWDHLQQATAGRLLRVRRGARPRLHAGRSTGVEADPDERASARTGPASMITLRLFSGAGVSVPGGTSRARLSWRKPRHGEACSR